MFPNPRGNRNIDGKRHAGSPFRWQISHQQVRAYGVPRGQIELTGFPLPPELLGGPKLPALRQALAGRLVRLDRKGVFREQDVELLALSCWGPMRARLAGECAELVGDLTRLRFHINCRQLAIYLRAISDELLYEHPFIGRVTGR